MPKPPSPILAPQLPSPISNLHSPPVFSTPVRNQHSETMKPLAQSRIASSLFDDVEPAASRDMVKLTQPNTQLQPIFSKPAMSGSSFPYKNIGSRWN